MDYALDNLPDVEEEQVESGKTHKRLKRIAAAWREMEHMEESKNE